MNRLGAGVMLACGALGFTVAAETVAWWRFGDLAPEGGKTTAGMVLTNTLDAAAYAAYPVTFTKTFTNNKATGTDPAYMPVLTNAFAQYPNLYVYDPITHVTNAVTAALHCPWGGNGTGLSGGAKVPVTPQLYGRDTDEGEQHDFTFECFFRTTSDGLFRSDNMSPIAGVPACGGSYGAWSIVLRKSTATTAYLWSRCSAYKKDSTSYGEIYGTEGVTDVNNITPDVWHHTAFVYTAADQTFRLYLDYQLASSTTISKATYTNRLAAATTGNAGHLFLGRGTFNSDRSLDGEIAEARFSRGALTPEQFLRFVEPGAKGDRTDNDKDLLAWYAFDTLVARNFLGQYPALAWGTAADYALNFVTPATGVAPALTSDTPGYFQTIRATETSDEELTNTSAVMLRTNNCANTYITFENAAGDFTADSFTLEFFFKTASRPRPGDDNTWSFGLADSAYFKIILGKSDGRLFCRPQFENSGDQGTTVSLTRLDDGEWHHVALVYDKQEGVSTNLIIYADYAKLYTWSGYALKSGPSKYKLALGVSRLSGAYDQFFDGEIDEVRLTRRARAQTEFLSYVSFKKMGDVLARIPFDGTSVLLPYGYQGMRNTWVTGTRQSPTNIPAHYSDYLAAEGDLSTRIADTGACRFEGGKITYPHISALNRANITIEFFWRPFDKFAPWPCVLGLSGVAGEVCDISRATDTDGTGAWSFYYDGTWKHAKLSFSYATTTNGVPRPTYIMSVSPAYAVLETHQTDNPWYGTAAFDGRWHHVAATLEEIEEGGVTKTRATTYFDYKKVATATLKGTLDCKADTTGLVMQPGAASTARLATWDIDEVRITGKVLKPEQFCRRYPKALQIILR